MALKLGLITDIHAELGALQKALDLLAKQNVDEILCSGDLVERGTEGDAVVRLLQERGIPSVQGNHDRDARWHQIINRAGAALNMPYLRDRTLNAETMAYLSNLPDELHINYEGVRLLVAHGTPGNKDDFLFPRSPKRKFRRVAAAVQADVVVVGHTHIPMHIVVDGVVILNPGSVCHLLNWGSGTCATLDLPQGIFNVFDLRTGKTVNVPLVKK